MESRFREGRKPSRTQDIAERRRSLLLQLHIDSPSELSFGFADRGVRSVECGVTRAGHRRLGENIREQLSLWLGWYADHVGFIETVDISEAVDLFEIIHRRTALDGDFG